MNRNCKKKKRERERRSKKLRAIFLEKISKISKLLAGLRKKRGLKINEIKNEREVSAETTEI